jgi:hypothetical protein
MELYLNVGFAVGFGVRLFRNIAVNGLKQDCGFKKLGPLRQQATATTTRDGLRKSRPLPVSLPVRSDF